MSRVLQLAVLWLLPYLGPDETALHDRADAEDWFNALAREPGMTPQEWLTADDPVGMLEFLMEGASDRKLRLFAAACCRRVWHQLTDPRTRLAVELAERHADCAADIQDVEVARQLRPAADTPFRDYGPKGRRYPTLWAASATLDEGAWTAAEGAASYAQEIASEWVAGEGNVGRREERKAQASLLRDIFGMLAFRPASIDPVWLTPTVISITQVIYDERRFEDLPVLADALEDAGCDNAEILSHCRGPGPHARGCFVLDLLLGRE